MPSPSKTRVAIYARVSTVNHGQDVGLQLDELERVAGQRGWTVVDTYTDEGVSGAKSSRPALDKMMNDASKGKFDVVMVWRFDRAARSVQHLLRLLDDLRSMGVDFISIHEAVDTSTTMGRMVFTFLAAVAEFERELIRERVQAGVDRARAKGKHCGRPVVVIDLRPAVAMLREGHGLKAISKALGVSRSTLRARLVEAGEWPRQGGDNPATRSAP